VSAAASFFGGDRGAAVVFGLRFIVFSSAFHRAGLLKGASTEGRSSVAMEYAESHTSPCGVPQGFFLARVEPGDRQWEKHHFMPEMPEHCERILSVIQGVIRTSLLGLTESEIAALSGLSEEQVRECVKNMEAAGTIRAMGRREGEEVYGVNKE
jgi:hypothetical protein